MNFWILIVLSIQLLVSSVTPFSIQNGYQSTQRGIGKTGSMFRSLTEIYSSPNDEEIKGGVVATKSSNDTQGTSFPIDLPSPILLATSMVLAIVGTGAFVIYITRKRISERNLLTFELPSGSAFDLGGGSPSLGFGTTAAIAAVTIPLCLYLFYASILKATAETEADDKEFMKGK